MLHTRGPHMPRIAPLCLVAAALAAAAILTGLATGATSAPAAPASSIPASSGFLPSKHGFAFVNNFSGSVLPKSFGVLGGLIQQSNYGLCGGMSFAAADFFLARRSVPSAIAKGGGVAAEPRLQPQPQAQTQPQPLAGTPLREFLHRRQLDSLGGLSAGLPQALRFAAWMSARDNGPMGTRAMTGAEMARVVRTLATGNITMLGLVYVGTSGSGSNSRGELTDNHQVVATAIKPRAGGFDVMLYDPNFPADDTARLVCTPIVVGSLPSFGPCTVGIPVMGLRIDRVAGGTTKNVKTKANTKPVRGVFIMPYTPVQPPADVLAPRK